MSGACPTTSSITWRADAPGGRGVAAGPEAAGRAGLEGRVEEVVTSRNDRRIDRPLLSGRPPSGRLVSGTRGQAGVCGDLWPGRVFGRLPHAGTSADTGGPCGSHRGHGKWCGARPETGPERVLAQAIAASKRGGHGRCPVSMATPRPPMREQEWTAADIAGHFRCGRPPCRPGSGHPRRSAASGVCPAAAVARGTGRRGGGRWWDAASAGGCGRAGRSGGRGAGRGRRSSPAGRASRPPRS
jgi:hypothetical protein